MFVEFKILAREEMKLLVDKKSIVDIPKLLNGHVRSKMRGDSTSLVIK